MRIAVGLSLLAAGASAPGGGSPAMRTAVDLTRAWAESAFSELDGAPARDRLIVLHEDVAGDTKLNTCAYASRPPLRLGERTYARGIGVNAHSVLRVSLSQPATRFQADIGLDRNVDGTAASVRFHVAVDGNDRFATWVLRPGDAPQSLDVPLAGAREFDLIVDDGGDGRGWDQGDWADARVVLEDGTAVWLDDLARTADLPVGLPFSFTYGGRPSAELLPTWTRDVTDDEVDATRRRRTVTLSDPATGLEVRAVCTIYTDTPGADWTLYLTNRGPEDTPAIEDLRALDVTVRPGLDGTPVLHRISGSDCSVNDWVPFEEPLPPGRRVELTPLAGRPSRGVGPFFTLDWGAAGVVTAVGWSGQWTASVERTEVGAVRLQAGMQFLHLRLRPGESIRSPRIMQLYWTGADLDAAHNLWRRTMLKHIVPQRDGRPVTPPIVHLSTSFYELNDSTEGNVLAHLRAIEGLGFEAFWLDAYWTRGGFPAGMGNYGFPLERVEPPDRFPGGLRPIGDAAHAAGMGFVVWFEPERVHPGTALAREHPEWVLSPGGDGAGLLNLGLPEAREYMTRYLIEAIRAYGIDGLRIDYNLDPLPFWQLADQRDPDRAGLTEIRCVEGLYRMWDDIRAAHPNLFIDNCASGGMRIDLETCSRAIPLWRTDATIDPLMRGDFAQAALQNQTMTAGLSRYLPLHVSGQMGATPYLFRSGFNGGISFCEDCRPDHYPKALLKAGITEGKRLRRYTLGDFHPLTPVTTSPRDWCVLQYDLPEEGAGMVIAFRRHQSPYSGYDCELRGIEEDASYEVTQHRGYEAGRTEQIGGSRLRRLGLRIEDCPGSMVVEYRRR